MMACTEKPDHVSSLRSYGAIAQLVERHNGIVEVAGSTPAGSTRPGAVRPRAFFYSNEEVFPLRPDGRSVRNFV